MKLTLINDGRLSRDETYLLIAFIISERGTCLRGKNGCVITQGNRIVSTGYNGKIVGNCDEYCDLTKGCEHAVHAEQNAIAFAASKGIKLEGSVLYSTSTPCYECSKLIIQAKVYKVVYSADYRLYDGYDLLKKNGVLVEQNRDIDFTYEEKEGRE